MSMEFPPRNAATEAHSPLFDTASGKSPQGVADNEAERAEPPAKRAKRGKYASKACNHCQKRKIKCDGALQCGPCVSKGRRCLRQTVAAHEHSVDVTASPVGTGPNDPNRAVVEGNSGSQRVDTNVLQRLARLENQLQRLLAIGHEPQHGSHSSIGGKTAEALYDLDDVRATAPASVEAPGAPDDSTRPDIPTFAGESSIAHTLQLVEKQLDQIGVTYQQDPSVPPSQPLTPSPHLSTNNNLQQQPIFLNYIQAVLKAHSIVVDRCKWDRFLQIFVDEVHVLYPLLHTPVLWERYNQLWDDSASRLTGEHLQQRDQQVQIAQIFVCLAIGRCTSASRIGSSDVRHSAGWSLFMAAMEILGDPIELSTKDRGSLLVLQTLTLVVVYLFRLDANERASKFLALAVSHSHHIGLHRQKVLSRMPVFASEMFCRLWWCIYVLDRRMSLETGLPFLIQDVNVDTDLPLDLSEDWLSQHTGTRESKEEGRSDVQEELSKCHVTPIPYLVCMIRYSKVVAKVWEALYGANKMDTSSNPLMLNYLEHLISSSENQTKLALAYNSNESLEGQTDRSSWWHVKQMTLMHMRWISLRLSIRQPILQRSLSSPTDEMNSYENEAICIQLAQRIIDLFNQIPDRYPKFEFPFLHYMARTAMISLGLIIKQPSLRNAYGGITLQISRDLKRYCRNTWVSGKFVRSIVRLNQMAELVLGRQQPKMTEKSFSQRHTRSTPVLTWQSCNMNTNINGANTMEPAASQPPKWQPNRVDPVSLSKERPPSETVYRSAAGSTSLQHSQTRPPNNAPGSPLSKPPQAQRISVNSPGTQIDASSQSPGSGMVDLVTGDFDFEEAINSVGFGPSVFLSRTSPVPLDSYGQGIQTSAATENHALNNYSSMDNAQATDIAICNGSSHDELLGVSSDWIEDLLRAGLPSETLM